MTSSVPFAVREHNLPAAHIREYARATSNLQDEGLRLHVRQYTPVDNPEPQKGDITIIGAHANGFPKELYEPLWEDLYHKLKATGTRIRTIYTLDAAWQGQSGILNADSLGNDPSWLDYTRDMQHMINILRPPRPLVGVGHSFGATALVNLAASHPRLLTALVLLDPTYTRYVAFPNSGAVFQPAGASIVRRDAWPDRAEAEKAFRRNPFYASWDERVFRRWMDFGIRDSDSDDSGGEAKGKGKSKGEGNGRVVLSTTKHQEVFTYLRPSWAAYDAAGQTLVDPSPVPDLDPTLQAEGAPTYPFYRPEGASTVSRLPGLRPPVLHVFGGRSMLSAPEFRRQKMELTGTGLGGSGGAARGRVAEVVGEPYGHLIPMEAPGFCADAAAGWIGERVAEWRAEEREYEAWARKSQEEKTTLSAEFIKYTGVKLRDGTTTQGRTDKPKSKI